MSSSLSQGEVESQERIDKLFAHLKGGFHYQTEETGGAEGLPNPQWSDVSEVNKASGLEEKRRNEQDSTDKNGDLPKPTIKLKRKMTNGK